MPVTKHSSPAYNAIPPLPRPHIRAHTRDERRPPCPQHVIGTLVYTKHSKMSPCSVGTSVGQDDGQIKGDAQYVEHYFMYRSQKRYPQVKCEHRARNCCRPMHKKHHAQPLTVLLQTSTPALQHISWLYHVMTICSRHKMRLCVVSRRSWRLRGMRGAALRHDLCSFIDIGFIFG